MKKQKKPLSLLISLMLLLTVSVVGTLAYLTSVAEPVTNIFTLAEVPNQVVETFDGTVKQNVQIENTGNIDAYIRAAVIVNWTRLVEDNNRPESSEIYYEAPVKNIDYTIGEWNTEDWMLGKDGYYYYKYVVAKDKVTTILFDECKMVTGADVPDGYRLSVEIVGQSIQADGTDTDGTPPVELAWPVVEVQNVVDDQDTEDTDDDVHSFQLKLK